MRNRDHRRKRRKGWGGEMGWARGPHPPHPPTHPPKKNSSKYRVKSGHCFSYVLYFRAKMSCPQSWLNSHAYSDATILPISVSLSCPITTSAHPQCVWFCSETLALYKSLTYLLTYFTTFRTQYRIACNKCYKQYVGQTSRKLKETFNDHRWY